MRLVRLVQSLSEKRYKSLLILCVLMILSSYESASAQSGRKNKNATSPQPPVAAEPKADAPTSAPPKKSAPLATIIVGGDKNSSTFYNLSYYVEVAMAGCMDRIKESSGFETIGGGNMTRKDAIDRAKRETASYVLWLEMRTESDSSQTNLTINYYLYTPQTAKIQTSGHVYVGETTAGTGPVGIGIPSVTKHMPIDYQVKESGREIADRVVSKFPVIKRD
ncbi:MAG TPA: hypothetical protein VKB86_05520 [Pyrinomonadaceae bacterium]|nr:hypothetical protein [Pyrinomonadaceae bacterium]